MLYKVNLWMRRIGSVLLDFILMTLSQNWGTHVELVAKTRKGSNSLLISASRRVNTMNQGMSR